VQDKAEGSVAPTPNSGRQTPSGKNPCFGGRQMPGPGGSSNNGGLMLQGKAVQCSVLVCHNPPFTD
jgi:hypothetical protein